MSFWTTVFICSSWEREVDFFSFFSWISLTGFLELSKSEAFETEDVDDLFVTCLLCIGTCASELPYDEDINNGSWAIQIKINNII